MAMEDWQGARDTLVSLRNLRPNDLEANDQLGAIDQRLADHETTAQSRLAASVIESPEHVLLFTGHMVDAPGRKSPRFPRTTAAEEAARQMIQESIQKQRPLEAGRIVGVAGGACGGDIL